MSLRTELIWACCFTLSENSNPPLTEKINGLPTICWNYARNVHLPPHENGKCCLKTQLTFTWYYILGKKKNYSLLHWLCIKDNYFNVTIFGS